MDKVIIMLYTIVILLFLVSLPGCGQYAHQLETNVTASPFASFRDIPGVTNDEIAAIEALQQAVLQRENGSLVYGMIQSTETFVDEDGEVGGYTAMICEWLTELFGIKFTPAIYDWGDIVQGLQTYAIDFCGEFTPTEERRKMWFMTDSISERSVKYMRIAGSGSLSIIQKSRLPRYVFLDGSIAAIGAAALADHPFETVFANDYATVYTLLKSGECDAFIEDGFTEAAFDIYGDIVTEDFFPLIFNTIAMTTFNPALEPIISVVTKAQQNGAMPYLNKLYNEGYETYKRHKFFMLLNEEEKEYLRDTASVPMAYQYFNYPIAFYDFRSKKWDGISIDILREVEKLAGFTFEIINDEYTEMPELIAMLADGRAHIFCDLIYSTQRAPHFIWNKNKFMSDQYALLSKIDYPNVNINEIPYKRVSLVRSTAHEEMFRTWFPGALYATQYPNSDDAFLALERDEVDLVMVSKSKLLWYSNYYEFSGYKANFPFNYFYESAFAFNKDQKVLCSIVDKAVSVIETSIITEQWLSKTYDFRARLLSARQPWLIGAVILVLALLAMLLTLIYRGWLEKKHLVKQQTEIEAANRAKSSFLANMSHEMRTPMNVIVGLTDLMLEENNVPEKTKETLEKVNMASNTLMGLINDVLDISKIEAGKLDLTPVQYCVPSLLNDIITLNMIRIEEKPITFKLDFDENLPLYLFGDDLRVKQILNNLLSNAFKYTKEGTVTLGAACQQEGANGSPTKAASPSDIWVSFYVNDTGIGIRAEDMEKLFTDYNQVDTHANREIEGTGLGLSITKEFVGLMGGKITVESEYGVGTTFRVCIRQGFVTDTTIGKETVENLHNFRYSDKKKQAQEKLVRPNLSYARVLVVDDLPMNLDVAAGMLRKYKMQVDCVSNGQDAINHIAAVKPVYNAIFMDHMMPGMDGIETTKKIRSINTEYAKSIPIIALTANAVAGNEQLFLEHGFNAFLPKPFNVMTLDSIIQRWVRDKGRE
jgi:signal transduction histidine kinase/CheY-like chemotaxis protein